MSHMVPLQYQLLSFDVSGSQVPVLSAALVFVDRATENSQRDPQKRVVRRPLCPFMPLFFEWATHGDLQFLTLTSSKFAYCMDMHGSMR
jgi:hypothetical protein